VKRATENDSKDIWEWRTNSLTRRMFKDSGYVCWADHHIWYKKSLADPNRYIYVGFLADGAKVGVCRFDIDEINHVAEVSINLNPTHRGRGLSLSLLTESLFAFSTHRIVNLSAKIKKKNIPSVKCFSRAGFNMVKENNYYYYYFKRSEGSFQNKL